MDTVASFGIGRWMLWLLVAANVAALVVGALLWARPQRYLRWFEPKKGNPRSVRQVVKPLDLMRDADRLLLNYPRFIGAIVAVSSLFILIKGAMFVSGLAPHQGGKLLERLFGTGRRWSPQAWEYLWQNLVVILTLGALFTLCIGLLALSRFALLQRWSLTANRWVSGRRATKDMAQPYYGPDSLMQRRPRTWGAVISIAALYSASVLLWLMWRG